MKKIIITILLLLLLACPVSASKVEGRITGFVVPAASKNLTAKEIRAEIKRITALIAHLQALLNQLIINQ